MKIEIKRTFPIFLEKSSFLGKISMPEIHKIVRVEPNRFQPLSKIDLITEGNAAICCHHAELGALVEKFGDDADKWGFPFLIKLEGVEQYAHKKHGEQLRWLIKPA